MTGSQDCTVKPGPSLKPCCPRAQAPRVALSSCRPRPQRCHDAYRTQHPGGAVARPHQVSLSGCLLSPPGHQQCGCRPNDKLLATAHRTARQTLGPATVPVAGHLLGPPARPLVRPVSRP